MPELVKDKNSIGPKLYRVTLVEKYIVEIWANTQREATKLAKDVRKADACKRIVRSTVCNQMKPRKEYEFYPKPAKKFRNTYKRKTDQEWPRKVGRYGLVTSNSKLEGERNLDTEISGRVGNSLVAKMPELQVVH